MNVSITSMPSRGLLNEMCPFAPVPGCPEIIARRAQAVFALWGAWEREAGGECPVPFWAVTWPAARVLARLLLEEPDIVKGKEVIEIGCGGAVASIAAKKVGARRVIANDTDPIALEIARDNASQNGVDIIFDGQSRIETGLDARSELVLCSDFFYTKSDSLVLSGLMTEWRDKGLSILIADGGRAFVPGNYRQVLREEWVDVDPDLEGREKRLVRILRF